MIVAALSLWFQVAVAAPPTLVVRTAAARTTIPVLPAASRTAPATVSADRLATALGGTLTVGENGRYRLRVGESVLEFIPGVPYARADSQVVPLADAPSVSGKTLYLPFQVVSEIIPRMMTGLLYDAEAGEVRAFNTAARRGEPTPMSGRAMPPANDSGDAEDAEDPDEAAPAAAPGRRARHLVVVDAGHGGVDNGMTGPIGGTFKIYEKHITLAVAKLVAQELRASGVKVLMTRTTDTLIALHDRGRIANKHHGDVFVSIHVNATGRGGRDAARERGYETYFLAEAKTEDARRVEAMENEAVRFETSVNVRDDSPLSFILNDMAQNEHLRESNELAQLIQDDFRRFHPGPNRGVQQANFAVLRGSFMPAVLVEIGFGTNPSEASFINDAENQRTIARSVAKSVLAYLDRYDARVGAGK